MPSAIRRLFNFSNKKKGHHGSKFQEFNGYDNQRFPSYPTITQNLGHPQYYQQHQPQQSHIQHGHSFQNQYQQAHPPPHSFSHRQQHQSQFQQQNILVQSPQLVATPAVTSTQNQCQCQHCTAPNQLGYNHQIQANPAQLLSPPQAIVSPTVAPAQIQMVNSQMPTQTAATLPVQPMVSVHHHHHQQQQQQQQVSLMQLDHPVLQQQCIQVSHPQHQINSCHDLTHQYANQVPEYTAPTAQCTCHHCPNHPQRVLAPQNQQFQSNLITTPINEPPQQQFMQHTMGSPQMTQQLDLIPPSICQHQMVTGQMPHTQVMQQQPCGNQFNSASKSQVCSSHDQNLNSSLIMSSSTPRIQHQEQSQQQQQQQQQVSPYQQQYTNMNTMSMPQFHYHTIQTNQYQQQKQVAQQHNRIQSLHQQISQSPNQSMENQTSHVIQPTTQSHPQVDSRVQEFSRYANVRSIIDESIQTRRTTSQSSKYQEHVYCNQKPEIILPPYGSPPSYETFVENRKSYMIGMSGQHMTHHSESLVSQKTKDSSYENLRRFSPYGNLGEDRHEPGSNSQTWDGNCSSSLTNEIKEDSSRTNVSLVY